MLIIATTAMKRNDIGDIIKSARERRNITRYELAKRSGVQATHIRKIEEGLNDPSFRVLERLANVLELAIKIE